MPIHFVRSRCGQRIDGGRTRRPDVADQHERTACAEQIAGRQQRDDQQSAIVHPGDDRGEIVRGDLGTEETLSDENAPQSGGPTSWSDVRA